MTSKEKVRKEILEKFNDSIICNCCSKYSLCDNRNKKKDFCYDPIRELYDMEYALKG